MALVGEALMAPVTNESGSCLIFSNPSSSHSMSEMGQRGGELLEMSYVPFLNGPSPQWAPRSLEGLQSQHGERYSGS